MILGVQPMAGGLPVANHESKIQFGNFDKIRMILSGILPVEESTWGRIKSLYGN